MAHLNVRKRAEGDEAAFSVQHRFECCVDTKRCIEMESVAVTTSFSSNEFPPAQKHHTKRRRARSKALPTRRTLPPAVHYGNLKPPETPAHNDHMTHYPS